MYLCLLISRGQRRDTGPGVSRLRYTAVGGNSKRGWGEELDVPMVRNDLLEALPHEVTVLVSAPHTEMDPVLPPAVLFDLQVEFIREEALMDLGESAGIDES